MQVNTYVGKVAAARSATSTRDAYVTLDVSDSFTGPGGTFDTDEFDKDDIVYYTYSYKTGERCIESMGLAEQVTGTMSTYTTTGSVTVAGTKYNANAKSATNIYNLATTVDRSKDVTVYLDPYGYALYVDADTSVEYAVVLNYTANAGDFNDTDKAKLLLSDGTVVTVEVDVPSAQVPSTTPSDEFNAYTANKLSKYDIVSYSIDSDDVYDLNLVADAQNGNDGGAFELKSGSNTFSIVAGNVANVNGSKVTHYADGKTIFLVADTSGDKDTYSVYEGIANVPTITKEGTSNSAVTVFMDSTDSNDPATVVFIQKDANMSMSSDNKDVIYVKGSSAGTSYTADLGYYYEYDAFINGEATTVKVSNNSTMRMTSDALIYGPVYNDKGVMTGFEDRVDSTTTTDGSLRYATTTDSVTNDVIKLGGIPYAYTSDVNVYFVNVDGDLEASTITAIAKDDNDKVFYKVNDDGRLTDVYIKVVDETETVTPGTSYAMSNQVVRKASDNTNFAVTFTTETALTATDKVTITITRKDASMGDAFVGSATVNAQAATTQNLNTGIALPGAGNYVAVITVTSSDGTVRATGTTVSTYVA